MQPGAKSAQQSLVCREEGSRWTDEIILSYPFVWLGDPPEAHEQSKHERT